MTFNESVQIVLNNLSALGINLNPSDYDGLIVKELKSSNTLDDNRSTNQTHIALTGEQMDIFPYTSAHGYFENDYIERDETLKKFFITNVSVLINEDNYNYLYSKTSTENPTPIVGFNNGELVSHTCVYRSRRDGAQDQAQLSLLEQDDKSFVYFRRLLNENDYIVFLKHKTKFCYSVFGIKAQDANGLDELNNRFYKDTTFTLIDPMRVIENAEVVANFTIEDLGKILKDMYNNGPGKTSAQLLFCLKYGAAIERLGCNAQQLMDASGLNKDATTVSDGIALYKVLRDYSRTINSAENSTSIKVQTEEAIPSDLTIEDLAGILKEMRDHPAGTGTSTAVHMFGIKYGQLISEKYSFAEVCRAAGLGDTKLSEEIRKGYNIFRSMSDNEYGIGFYDNSDDLMKKLFKFKNLLSFFVNQLDINNDLKEGEKKTGTGYKEGSSFRVNYEDYRDYGSFTLDCNISNFNRLRTSHTGNYINKTTTSYNINPIFDDDSSKVVKLCLTNYGNTVEGFEKEYSIEDLCLDGDEITDTLKSLFFDYLKLISGYDYSLSKHHGENKIVYGTPGCGKSYFVDHEWLGKNEETGQYTGEFEEENIIRTTFYQDYSYTDFVGQIIPYVTYETNEDGKEQSSAEYKFVPGPFTLAFERAIAHPAKKVALVIEEINRGNAPSIFGDLFQLLDRVQEDIKDADGNVVSPKGTSDYGIVNTGLINYLKDNNHNNKKCDYLFNKDEIKLPANLYIFATMNTSDQNVFTLDTAFKRRWEFKKIPNTFNGVKEDFKDRLVPGMQNKIQGMEKMTWEIFVDKVNNYILHDKDLLTSEDKQIGVYFVPKDMLLAPDNSDDKDAVTDKTERFSYKVFEYLWDDVAKYSREKWFVSGIDSLDKLIEEYKKGNKVLKDEVFFDKN